MYLEGSVPIPWRFRRPFERAAHALSLAQTPRQRIAFSQAATAGTLVCVGDVALHQTRSWRPEELLTDVLPLWKRADARIGNLETVCTTRTTPAGTIGSSLRADPAALEFLSGAGFTAVTVANNHSLDYGSDALAESISRVRDAGIAVCGYAEAPGQRTTPTFFRIGQLRAGMLGYCDAWRPPATEPLALVPAAAATEDEMIADVRALAPEVDIVIVQVHWGYEFALHPFRRHRDLARKLADAGARLVLCHHAHVPMAFERWGESFISHGLGNWLFEPCDYLIDGHDWTTASYLLEVKLGATAALTSVEIVPVETVWGPTVRLMQGWKRRRFLQSLERMSERLDNTDFLQRCETSRIVCESSNLVQALFQRSEPELEQISKLLTTPVNREMITHLASLEEPAPRTIARFLRRFSGIDQHGKKPSEMLQEESQNLRSALKLMPRCYRWQDTFVSRVP